MLTVYPAWEPTLATLVRNLAVAITVGAVLMSIVNGFLSLAPAPVLVNLVIPLFVLLAVMIIRRTGTFTFPFLIIIVCIFLVIYPIAFFATGGLEGTMPYYYFIAVAVTALMLQGLRLYLALALEIVVFVGCMVFSINHPEAVASFDEVNLERSLPVCLLTIVIEIALVVHSVYRFYLRTALELESSNERLREAAKNKDAFLALIAHELKTPMAIMSSHAQESARILSKLPDRSPELDQVQLDVEIMMNQAESLSDMVTQLLDISRINDGRLVLSIRPLALSEVVQSTLAQCAPICAENGNQLRLARGGAHPQVKGDSARLGRVLVNLIANATRHTHNGTITLSVVKEDGFARVTVADTGEGISPEALEAVRKGEGTTVASYPVAPTAPMSDAAGPGSGPSARSSPGQLDDELADAVSLPVPVAAGSRHGGLGLGLRIVRHIVEAHGGVFELESELGQGTRASFTLPLAN
ncbi:MAG: HAMP domain-containing histidine kinase [Bifidobacteriaceae bacterium]|jgi:signal transduction histidine kinase|nr:HAMP domain-containing histidine kinase [Bifidobacteriaceae bacterium]